MQLGEVHSSEVALDRFVDKAGSLLRRIGHFRSSFRLKDRWVSLQVNSTVDVLPQLLHPSKAILSTHKAAIKQALLGEGKRAWRPLSLSVILLSRTFLHDFETAQNWWFIRHVWEQIRTGQETCHNLLTILEHSKTKQTHFGLAFAFNKFLKQLGWVWRGDFFFLTDLGRGSILLWSLWIGSKISFVKLGLGRKSTN